MRSVASVRLRATKLAYTVVWAALAARYTDDRRANFDIYLPVWLARYNKHVFGPLYVAGVVFAAVRCLGAA